MQRQLLHGEQCVEIYSPLPVNGNFIVQPQLIDIQDKGKAALVITRAIIIDPDNNNEVLAVNEVTAFVRKSGGFGRTKPAPRMAAATAVNKPPARQPDAVIEEKTSPDLAALYRLNADYNPLHIDPAFSSKGGFDKPILHGLCTFGISTKHVMQQYAHGNPDSIKSIKVCTQWEQLPSNQVSGRSYTMLSHYALCDMLKCCCCAGTICHVGFPWRDFENRNVAR